MRSRGALAILLLLSSSASVRPRNDADVLVVGAGIAGLSAALEAARGGASVLVIDASSVFGGHAVMSGGHVAIVDTPLQRSRGIHDSPQLAEKDFLTWGVDANPTWVHYYSEHSRHEIYDWVTSLGVHFEDLFHYPGNSVPRAHVTTGAGMGLVAPIFRACVKESRIRFIWNLRATDLIRDGNRIDGVVATDTRSGETRKLRASAVILASGGFQSNLDMVRANWPKAWPMPQRILAGSGINSTGSAQTFAHAAGAALTSLDHQWIYETGLPDPRYPGANRGLNAFDWNAVWVNREGKRFVDEWLTRRERLAALLQQPGATYWLIFDSQSKDDFGIVGTDWTDRARVDREILGNEELVKRDDTMEGLARRAGLPPQQLVRTISEYNAMLASGRDTQFGRFPRNGNELPPKIIRPPFYAAEFFPLARKSMGGIRSTERAACSASSRPSCRDSTQREKWRVSAASTVAPHSKVRSSVPAS